MVNNDVYLYFLYSEQQNKERTAIDKKMSKTFTPGVVIVGGRRTFFTEISRTKTTNKYSDCKLVAEGWSSKMKYTPVRSVG